MGYLHVTKLTSKKDKANYIYQLTQDINALELMLSENMIETAPIHIGAEQEFCITTDEFLPNTNSL
ncbi:MAG: CBS domain-containing protein, partial [Mangrovimonas sp.]|nr:CBS domain-containing protein [Mangrovimonas sp.]